MKGKYPKITENQNAGTLELLYKQTIEDIRKENILREQRTKMLEPKNCCINNGLKKYERKISEENRETQCWNLRTVV